METVNHHYSKPKCKGRVNTCHRLPTLQHLVQKILRIEAGI